VTPSLFSQLQQQYQHLDGVDVVLGRGDLPELHIVNRFCRAEISLLGGQVLSFQRAGDEHPLLFISDDAFFQLGKGIKGGAPVCWPWFGDDPEGRGAHGFARSAMWEVAAITTDDCGVIQVDMTLPQSVFEDHPEWPFASTLKTSIRLGKWLSISLETTNSSDHDMPLTQALHTYFCVADATRVKVLGLESSSYLDKVVDFARVDASGAPILVGGEVDRIYDNNVGNITLVDSLWQRSISITSQGSGSAIVWNPWVSKAKAMADFGDDEYQRMICIETANAADDKRVLAPGQTHVMSVEYRISSSIITTP
jgi:glucose-6-phosphate 1-epimerase